MNVYKDANGCWVITTAKYGTLTLADMAKRDPGYLSWFRNSTASFSLSDEAFYAIDEVLERAIFT